MAILSGGELVLSDAFAAFTFRTNYLASTGFDLTSVFASYGELYRKQLWVYTLVRKRALATRRLPLKVYRRAEVGREEARDSTYAQVLATPNPQHDAAFLWEWTSSTEDIYGEAMWLKIRGRDGEPRELWPIHPSNLQVQRADDETAKRWGVQKGSLVYLYSQGPVPSTDPEYAIPEADVVHFRTYNPQSTVRGLSPLEPLRATLVNEDAARRASSAFWKNGSRPSTFLSSPNKLTPDAIDRLKANWEDLHGGVDNFGKTAVLEQGLEPKQLSLSAEESQYIQSRKLNREEACAVYDVPPPVVHILDHATFSNITEQMRSMYRDTMAPKLGAYEATLDHQLRPDFGEADLYAEFLLDEVLRGDFEVRTAAYRDAINSGWMKPAEARDKENMPFVEGSDRLFVNATLIPIDEVSQHTSPNVPAEEPGQGGTPAIPGEKMAPALAAGQKPAALPALPASKALRSVMGRLGRVKDLKALDIASLVAGLNGETQIVTDAYEQALVDGIDVAAFRDRLRAVLTEGA